MSRRGFSRPQVHRTVLVQGHGRQLVERGIVHCTISPNVPGLRDVLAIPAYWLQQGKGYGTQLVIDGEGNTVRCVYDHRTAWGCAGSNTGSFQIEFIGYATYSAADWDKCKTGLKQGAKWAAYAKRTYGVPLVSSVRRGWATHKMHSDAFGISTHTDPGPGFPWKRWLAWAVWYSIRGWYPEPTP